MAISTDFNYEILLGLDRASLVAREIKNHLGTAELVLDYNKIETNAREEAVEWLWSNRLTLTDPDFGYKTFDGAWKSVSIIFNEKTKAIRQRFQIDSVILNDVSKTDETGEVLSSYYFRIVDPEAYNIPASIHSGEVWTKTVNDNGDGTYDVRISKETGQSEAGSGSVGQAGDSGIQAASDSIFVSGATTTAAVNGEYEYVGLFTYATDNPLPYWKHATLDYWIWLNGNSSNWVIDDEAPRQLVSSQTDLYAIMPAAPETYKCLGSYNWVLVSTLLPETGFAVEVGRNGPPMEETSDITTQSGELEFVKDGGTIANPTAGQTKTIKNDPIGNGWYRSTVVTRSIHGQRVPATYGMIIVPNTKTIGTTPTTKYTSVISGRNRSFAEFIADTQYMGDTLDDAISVNKYDNVNSMSVNVNSNGLYDYHLSSSERP